MSGRYNRIKVTLAMGDVFESLDWKMMTGINVDGAHLSHLRFSVDVVIIGDDLGNLYTTMKELIEASKHEGLQINMKRTQVWNSEDVPVVINGITLDAVDDYIYLGHRIKLGKDNQTAEVSRRLGLSLGCIYKTRLS